MSYVKMPTGWSEVAMVAIAIIFLVYVIHTW